MLTGEWRSFTIVTAPSIGGLALKPLCAPPSCLLDVFLCATNPMVRFDSTDAWLKERNGAIARMLNAAGLNRRHIHVGAAISPAASSKTGHCGGKLRKHRNVCWLRILRHEVANKIHFDWLLSMRFDVGYFAPLPSIQGLVAKLRHGSHYAKSGHGVIFLPGNHGLNYGLSKRFGHMSDHLAIVSRENGAINAYLSISTSHERVVHFRECGCFVNLGPTQVPSSMLKDSYGQLTPERVLEATLISWNVTVHYRWLPWVLVRGNPNVTVVPASGAATIPGRQRHGWYQAECFRQIPCCVTLLGPCSPSPLCPSKRVAMCAAAYRNHACIRPSTQTQGFRCSASR